MTTYTIAIGSDMILATVPDGGDIATAASVDGYTGEYEVITGLTLSDALPEGADAVWVSGNGGWLFLPNGNTATFAYRA
jgi:hypothetical protein